MAGSEAVVVPGIVPGVGPVVVVGDVGVVAVLAPPQTASERRATAINVSGTNRDVGMMPTMHRERKGLMWAGSAESKCLVKVRGAALA